MNVCRQLGTVWWIPNHVMFRIQLTVMFADGVTRLEKMKKNDHLKVHFAHSNTVLHVHTRTCTVYVVSTLACTHHFADAIALCIFLQNLTLIKKNSCICLIWCIHNYYCLNSMCNPIACDLSIPPFSTRWRWGRPSWEWWNPRNPVTWLARTPHPSLPQTVFSMPLILYRGLNILNPLAPLLTSTLVTSTSTIVCIATVNYINWASRS